MCVCMCKVRACVRASVYACVRVFVHACVRACVHVEVRVREVCVNNELVPDVNKIAQTLSSAATHRASSSPPSPSSPAVATNASSNATICWC
jgi:hypothetical protein